MQQRLLQRDPFNPIESQEIAKKIPTLHVNIHRERNIPSLPTLSAVYHFHRDGDQWPCRREWHLTTRSPLQDHCIDDHGIFLAAWKFACRWTRRRTLWNNPSQLYSSHSDSCLYLFFNFQLTSDAMKLKRIPVRKLLYLWLKLSIKNWKKNNKTSFLCFKKCHSAQCHRATVSPNRTSCKMWIEL